MIMYLSVYLFKNKPAGPHELDFVIGNGALITKSHVPKRGGRLPNGGLLERGVNREGRLNRAFTVDPKEK